MRSTRAFSVLALASGLALFPTGARAAAVRAPESVAAAPAVASLAAAVQTQAPAEPEMGLPTPPKTLRAYRHVFISFALAWLLVFGYALSLGVRFRRLEREVDALEGSGGA